MKTYIVILLVILFEACTYGWLLGEENEKLKAENAVLQQKISDQKDKIGELSWAITKMDMLIAGKAIGEIFNKDMVKDGNAQTAEINDDNNEEDVIFID